MRRCRRIEVAASLPPSVRAAMGSWSVARRGREGGLRRESYRRSLLPRAPPFSSPPCGPCPSAACRDRQGAMILAIRQKQHLCFNAVCDVLYSCRMTSRFYFACHLRQRRYGTRRVAEWLEHLSLPSGLLLARRRRRCRFLSRTSSAPSTEAERPRPLMSSLVACHSAWHVDAARARGLS